MDFASTKPAASQAARRHQVWQLTCRFCHYWFDSDGNWTNLAGWSDEHVKWEDVKTRTIVWLCFGLLPGTPADVELANAILEKLEFHMHVPARSDAEITSPFDIFVTNHAVHLLVLHAGKMTPTVREKLEGWARAGLADYAGNRQCDYQFHGYNDNMPAKATLGMVLGGEYFGDEAAVEHGLWNLRQLRDLLTRRGLMSEFNSPTYTPFSLVNLTSVALHARSNEARELAGLVCERLWAEILGHFHAPTGMNGGPYSRAYLPDTLGHLCTLSNVLWLARGEGIIPDPLREMESDSPRLSRYHHSQPDSMGRFALMASCEYFVPGYLDEWVNKRNYPFQIRATAERGDGGGTFHAGEVVTTQYQEEDFSLGTAEGESWSQAEVWYLRYRRTISARGIEDIRTVYAGTFINDQSPNDGIDKVPPNWAAHTLQDRRVALVLTRPTLSLAGMEIERLKLSLVLPTHFSAVDKLEVRDGHVFVQDGPVRLAFRPLNAALHGGAEPIEIEGVTNYQVISFPNYAGPKRVFTREELGGMINGFVSVVGLTAEESHEDFVRRVTGAELVDYWYFKLRTVRYRLGGTLLEAGYAVDSDRVRYACINGKPVPRPIWEAGGLPAERLPFLSGAAETNPLSIPFEHLRVVWAPDAPWIISSRGSAGSNRQPQTPL